MGTFVPGTKEEQQALLEASGYTSFDDLFSVIPASVYLKKPLPLEEGLSEMETDETIRALAAKNRVYRSIFRGAGSYDHYIPAIVPLCRSNVRRKPVDRLLSIRFREAS